MHWFVAEAGIGGINSAVVWKVDHQSSGAVQQLVNGFLLPIFIVSYHSLWFCYCVCCGRDMEFDSHSACSFQVLCRRSLKYIGWLHCCFRSSRDGFRERGALGHLSFGAPSRCDQFGRLSEKRENMPLPCVPLKHLSFVVPTLVLHLP